ncbi:MAG: tetratricopeptide repeat protein [Candidatus Acidiferrales bacterium]
MLITSTLLLALAALALPHSAQTISPRQSSKATIQKATAATAAGDVESAADYVSAIAAQPKDAALRVAYANFLLGQRRYAESIAQSQEALKLSPHRLDAEIALATAYRGVHNYDQTKLVLEAAHREHPADAQPLAALGDLEIELQMYDMAITHLRAALAIRPGDVPTRERLLIAYKAKGDSADAIAQASAILAREPKNALAYFTRAQIYSDRNQDVLARKDAERAVSLQPHNPRARALLGKIMLRAPEQETPAEAEQRCAHATAILDPLAADPTNPPDSDSLFLLARAYQCAGDDAKAEQYNAAFEKSSKNDRTEKENQTQAKHLVQQANELAQQNDFDGSLKLLEQAIDLDPISGAAYSQLAKLYYSAGKIDEAADAVAKAIERDPNQPDYLYVRGKIFEKQNELDEALADFRRTTEIDPNESDAYFEMGQIYQQQGDRSAALDAFENAARISPDDPDYKRALAALRSATSQ